MSRTLPRSLTRKSSRRGEAILKAGNDAAIVEKVKKAKIENCNKIHEEGWTLPQISVFQKLFRKHKKDFSKIADEMEGKSTKDVVFLYYHLDREKFLPNIGESKLRAKMSKKQNKVICFLNLYVRGQNIEI